jgi:large subunit ribosomal protein L3
MLKAIIGRKVGMTQIFGEGGGAIPVTVIEAGPCTVTQLKTVENDGYAAVQIGFGEKKIKNVTRPELGHLGHPLPQTETQKKRQQQTRAKARQEARTRGESGLESEAVETEGEETEPQQQAAPADRTQQRARARRRAGGGLGPFQVLREVKAQDGASPTIGQVVAVDIFSVGEQIDVIGISKGKGFAGVMKRHGFKGGQRTHGQSDRMRAPGSIGAGTTPGRVFKGTRMAGKMGNDRITITKLEVVQADPERNLLVVKGSIPGNNGGIVIIRKHLER